MKKIVIFNQRTAGMLMFKGFTLKAMNKNNKNENMNVFIFDDTEDLRAAISQYDEFIKANQDYLTK